MKVVEVEVKKYLKNVEKDGRRGKWVTRAFLMESQKYTKQLVLQLLLKLAAPCMICWF